jgi:hypothetical protein
MSKYLLWAHLLFQSEWVKSFEIFRLRHPLGIGLLSNRSMKRTVRSYPHPENRQTLYGLINDSNDLTCSHFENMVERA